mmetsp:Transcript_25744/g.43706  ORF Transcript_25744/g.43706 Transcript_25744/m.43706 type:complete len:95 (-) Transcript_25744:100-384(-)
MLLQKLLEGSFHTCTHMNIPFSENVLELIAMLLLFQILIPKAESVLNMMILPATMKLVPRNVPGMKEMVKVKVLKGVLLLVVWTPEELAKNTVE